jgi:hypothetical protein
MSADGARAFLTHLSIAFRSQAAVYRKNRVHARKSGKTNKSGKLGSRFDPPIGTRITRGPRPGFMSPSHVIFRHA